MISEELTLQDFGRVLRHRKQEFALWWGLVFLGSVIYVTLATPIFRAESMLRVPPQDDSSSHPADLGALSFLGVAGSGFNIETLLGPQIIREAAVRLGRITPDTPDHEAAKAIEQLSRRVSVQAKEKDSQLVYLMVTSPSGRTAAEEANVLSDVIVKIIGEEVTLKTHKSKQFIESQLQEVEGRLHQSEDRLRRVQEKFGPQTAGNYLIGRLMDLKNKRTQLAQKFTPSHPEVQQVNAEIRSIEGQLQQLPNQEVDIARLARDVRLNEELFTMLTKRLEEARIMESARQSPVVLLEPAIEPMKPERPNKPFILGIGFILGLSLACTIVIIRHHLDTSLVTTQEIEAFLELPVLALIPHIERRSTPTGAEGLVPRKNDHLGQLRSRLIVHFPPKSAMVEVYHILRTNLPKPPDGRGQVLLFTSSITGEGKSVTSANFALAAAQAGIPTLLMDADLRKPAVDKLFDISHEPGLANYFYLSPRWEHVLVGWEKVQQHNPAFAQAINTSGLDNLHILPAGKIFPNPISLLSSERFHHLLHEMRQRFPLVIVDSAPVMLFADCTLIAPYVDGVALVYRFGRTARDMVNRTRKQLVAAKANMLGVVVNNMTKGASSESSYYSEYDYYDEKRRHY